MNKISVGDLVMVVRGHSCVIHIAAGIPFVVTRKERPADFGVTSVYCDNCGLRNVVGDVECALGFRELRIPTKWLQKIDPPAEPETVETHDEAPA